MGDRESRVLDQNFEVEFELGRENVVMLQLPSCFVQRVLSADVCSQPKKYYCIYSKDIIVSVNNSIP